MDAQGIEPLLAGGQIGRSVLVFPEVDSTNDIAADAAARGDANGLIVLAERQRAGRGRFGRVWKTPPGGNILMSIVLDNPALIAAPEALTLAAGLAVAQGVADATGLSPQLKWPNDVWLSKRKLAGVLIESKNGAMILGVGLNVAAAPPAEDVDKPATCLAEHCPQRVGRNELVAAIAKRLEFWTAAIIAGKLDDLHDAWAGCCGMLHDRVKITAGGKTYIGHVLDVQPTDGLHLVEDTGQHALIHAAGASLEVLSNNPA